jgi:two-component system, NarL family, invasion response regulator UvrY
MRNQLTILIAEDNKLMRETLRVIIGGMEDVLVAGEASNGEEAIALAKEHSPDIILMDINMSPVNGFEATRKILKEMPSVKIICLSMHNKASYAKNILQLGACGYVSKSSPHSEIITAIQKVSAGEKYIDKGLTGRVDI